MGTMLGFVVGYVMGARAGPEGLDALVVSTRALAASPEVKGILSGGLGMFSDLLRARARELATAQRPAALRRAA